MNESITPEPTEAATPEVLRRRSFLSRVSIVLGSACAAILGVPVVGFVLAPLFRRPEGVWQTVGRLDDFAVGRTVSVIFEDPSPLPWAGVTARAAAWLRRESPDRFVAFSSFCTHLGCPVRWMPQANLFLCPCHGGVYYQDGTVAAGPPPHPLVRYEVRVLDGAVQLKTSPIPITTTL